MKKATIPRLLVNEDVVFLKDIWFVNLFQLYTVCISRPVIK